MSRKGEIKREIKAGEEEIERLEKKRARSQSALLDAIISETKPDKADVEYFKVFSRLIEVERENLRKLKEELKKL